MTTLRLRCTGRGGHDHDRAGVTCREYPRRGRRSKAPVENDAGEGAFTVHAARGEQGIVDQNGLDADADRVHLRADAMRVPVGRRGREECPPAGRFRQPPVEAGCHLHQDERPPFAHQGEERLIERRRLAGAEADIDRDAAVA